MPEHEPERTDEANPPPPADELAVPIYVDDEVLSAIAVKRPPHPSNGWWALLWCVGYLLVTQVPAAMIFVVIYLISTPDALQRLQDPAAMKTPEYAQAMAPALLIAQIFGIIGSLIALRLVAGAEWTRKVALRLPSWQHVILVLLGFPGMYLLAAGVDMLAKELFRLVFNDESLFNLDEMVELFGQWPFHFAILAVAFGPGFAEELFCRGLLGRGLMGSYGIVGGILLTSFFFGILHIEPRQVAYATLIGIVLHSAYVMTRSLLIPILLHIVNNGLSIAALHSLPAEFRELGEGPQQIPIYIFAAAAVLVLAVGWALYETRARLVSTAAELPPWQPDFPGVEYPPPDSNTVVVRPAPAMIHWAVALAGVLCFVASIALASVTAPP